MANYTWYGKPWSTSGGCPGTDLPPGWYSGTTLITSSYKNPATGKPYTPAELESLAGGTTTGGVTTGTTTAIPTSSGTQGIWFQGEYLGDVDENFSNLNQAEQEAWIKENFGTDVSGQMWGIGGAPPKETHIGALPITTTTCGVCGTGAKVSTPEVTPAPAYEPTPEQLAWQEEYGGKLSDWLEAGGYGIPEETQQQMIQQQTDVLKAREKEAIRVMRNNMERRGITNSGFVYANEQAIKANTTKALAESIRDIKIKSSLMKLASFERAMGQTAQFLGYLSEQSQLKYEPEYATWQAEQMAKMQKWQAEIDLRKMRIAQAYQQQNMQLAHQYNMELAQQQHQYDIELAQMELEASQQAATWEGIGNIAGILLTLPFLI